ncbi:molybdopterin molybdenumtransferase MoeA [Tessaracoccus antarcticus]|uniref:Molybdopterin molybdenumtransferase n=2 Tax=Tessaracoccus antarcticus TaxID=2479848 RepID=A0A3M0GD80_9ACTN|nr:molybdopterin molybdenumtransferase MoeA [Tessaracoccus antarcticus]
MLSVEEYLAEVLDLVTPLGEVDVVPVAQAVGRTLALPIVATADVPVMANSAMDGFAVRAADLSMGAILQVVADVPAGSPLDPALVAGQCCRIMTGACVPSDADTIVPVELVDQSADRQRITVREVPARGAHVRGAGEDFTRGVEVLPAGIALGARELGLVSGAGVAEVTVVRRPRVAVVATGDELRPPGARLERGQIYESNGLFLATALAAAGADVVAALTLPDDDDEFAAGLESAASAADLVVLSGGVSVGDHDVVRIVLQARATSAFRHVLMQPGKPQGWALWKTAAGRMVPLVALPGNPLSTMVSFELFVTAVLDRLLGRASQGWQVAVAGIDWVPPVRRRQFVPVVVEVDAQGCQRVTPVHRRGSASHMVSAAAQADGLAMVEADVERVHAGDTVSFRRYR